MDSKMDEKVWVNIEEFLRNNSKRNDHFGNEYHVEETLGEGALGVVYRAIPRGSEHTQELKEEVAIKEIKVESLGDLAAAVKEVVMLKDVDKHPNVVKIYDDLSWYTTDDVSPHPDDMLNALKSDKAEPVDCRGIKFYIVMELLNGNLQEKEAMTADKDLVWKRVLSLTDGLEHLHKNKIFHGDLKLNNICLRDEDSLVLINFRGSMQVIPQNASNSSSPSTIDKSGDMIGYAGIIFGICYLYNQYPEYDFDIVPLLHEWGKEELRGKVLEQLVAPLGADDAERVTEVIVQCVNNRDSRHLIPSISAVSQVIYKAESYVKTCEGLNKFCELAGIEFEQRMLYRAWYEELIAAVPKDLQSSDGKLMCNKLAKFNEDDFPYLGVYNSISVDEINELAEAYSKRL